MKYCIANWKMNMTRMLGRRFLYKIESLVRSTKFVCLPEDPRMIICPPYTALGLMKRILSEQLAEPHITDGNIAYITPAELGAQNVNPNNDGAYTGEISTNMLTDMRIRWVIVGHSERRSLFGESNEFINLKVKSALDHNINPILCIGETLEERDSDKTEEVLHNQLKNCLKDVSYSDDFLIAYEPVWAIGTGKNADNDTIESANDIILNIIKELKYDIKNPKILYGGSVNNNNAENLLKICNLDGFLIGGASLDAEQFYFIYNALKGE